MEPSKAPVFQKPLRGAVLNERFATINKGMVESMMMKGEKYDTTKLEKEFYGFMCDDIIRERARIGEDWVVASVVNKRSVRDSIR